MHIQLRQLHTKRGNGISEVDNLPCEVPARLSFPCRDWFNPEKKKTNISVNDLFIKKGNKFKCEQYVE